MFDCVKCDKRHIVQTPVTHDMLEMLKTGMVERGYTTISDFTRFVFEWYFNSFSPEDKRLAPYTKRIRVSRNNILMATVSQLMEFRSQYNLTSHSALTLINEMELLPDRFHLID